MIIINPQWQGIGRKNPVPQGAEYIASLINHLAPEIIPLNTDDLITEEKVKGLPQITSVTDTVIARIQATKPKKIFTCGGDCSSDYAQMSYLNDLYKGEMGVIWIDAHADLNTPDSSPSGNFHGMTLRCLTGEGPDIMTGKIFKALSPAQISFSGLRDLDAEEIQYLDEHNIPVYSVDQTRAGALKNAPLPGKYLYVHVDIDSLDQSVFNDCATPTSDGFALDELTAMIKDLLARYTVIGASMTEYGPHEPDAASHIIKTLLFDAFDVEKNFA